MIAWLTELSKFSIECEPWGLIKSQVFVDGVSNAKGSGVGIILEEGIES